MMKRVSALLVCIVLALTLALPAGAAEQRSFLYPMMQVDDTVLSLVGAPVGEGTVTVTVNGEAFSNFNVTTALETGLPITYYCMVDQSSSFSNDQRDQQLRGLTTLSSTMRPQDSMILVTMGDKMTVGQPITGPEARQKAIEEACVYHSSSTALYDNIISAVKTAAEAQNNHSLNCVVLFTDGLDNPLREGSLEQAEQTVRDSGLSFNTISVMTPTTIQSVLTNARQMELFAEQSLGGIGSTPALDKKDSPTNVEDAVADIMRQVLSSSVIQLDAALLPREGNLDVAVSWEWDGVQRTDHVDLDTGLLPALPEPTEPETTVPETTAMTVPETTLPAVTRPAAAQTASNTGNRLLLVAVLCFVVVAVLIAVTLVLLRRRREGEEELPEPEYMEDDSRFIPQSAPVMDIKLDFSGLDAPAKKKEVPLPDLSQAVSTCRVRLVPEGNPQGAVAFTVEANSSVTLGRNGKADIILNETDTSLSGLHFELQWDSRVLHLRDRGSTNGTALNGVPLRPDSWTRVENKSVIQAGAASYTVFAEKK